MSARPRVLILQGCFKTGVQATGPNQSLAEMVIALRDAFDFRVLAEAAPGDRPGRWRDRDGVMQMPLAARRLGAAGLRHVIRSTPHDLLITNGFFDRVFTIPTLMLRRAGQLPAAPLLVAPRGEFSPEALALGARHKRAYLRFARATGLLRGVSIQATNPTEAARAQALLGPGTPVFVTPNIRRLPPLPPFRPRSAGARLRIAFVGRIDRMKNLDYALDRLAEADVGAEFNLYGPADDAPYWRECQERIAALPPAVQVTWHGAVPNSEVIAMLAGHDLFFLPTRGENFGHAIVDALSAGTPALISDETPWRGLQAAGAGWDLPLAEPQRFVAALREAARRAPGDESVARLAARRLIAERLGTDAAVDAMAATIRHLIAGASHTGATPRHRLI